MSDEREQEIRARVAGVLPMPYEVEWLEGYATDIPWLLEQLAAARAEAAALREAGEALWMELYDAAFGYADVHWKVQRDAPPVLDAWRALLAPPAAEGGAEEDEYRQPCSNGCLGRWGEGTDDRGRPMPVPMYCNVNGCDVESPGMSYKPEPATDQQQPGGAG